MLKVSLLIAFIVAAAVVIFASYSGQRRRAALENVAPSLGLLYQGSADESIASEWKMLPSFALRSQHFFSHVMVSGQVFVFDWTSRDGLLKKRDRNAQTVAAFRKLEANRPAFVWTDHGESEPSLHHLLLPLDLQVEAMDDWLIAFYPGKILEPNAIGELIKHARSTAAVVFD